jgi:tetratricopeptide (TPR) repeat protein
MKKSVVILVLALAAAAVAQDAAQPPAPAAASQKKEIKDPAEYNAYVAAIQQQDANAKISGLEAFLQQYPNTVMKEETLGALMGAYQGTNNVDKALEAAQRVLQTNPNNIQALALAAYNYSELAKGGKNSADNFAKARQYAERGLQALTSFNKPDGMSEADYQKQKASFTQLLNSVAGFAALQQKDSAAAQKYLRASVEVIPANLADVYPLALAYLTAAPSDDVNGLFFIARAVNLASGAGKDQITKFGRSRYTKFHGSDQGWAELLAQTATVTLPSAGFSITKYEPPTRAQQAAELVKTKQPKDMSFAEWQLVLSEGTQADKDTVWSAIKDVSLQMVGKVIKVTPTKLEIAASVDDIEASRTDIVLTMTGPIPAKLMPKENADLQFEGVPSEYAPSPFVMQMGKGTLLTAAAPPPVKKRPVRRKPAR